MKPKLTIDNDIKYWELPNGKFHRKDGPAIEYNNGDKFWFINDVEYTEQEYKYEMRSRNLKKLL
jgi:hypothetical protein